jgi:hypothetical protein
MSLIKQVSQYTSSSQHGIVSEHTEKYIKGHKIWNLFSLQTKIWRNYLQISLFTFVKKIAYSYSWETVIQVILNKFKT